jgi:hypothetical protein
MVLLEKLNKLEATITEQAAALSRISEATSILEPNFPSNTKILKSPFRPSQPRDQPRPETKDLLPPECGDFFLVPKGRWASLDVFMALPFIASLIPTGRKYENLVIDNTDLRRDCKLPNLHPGHVQKLIDRFLAGIHPLHPIIEVSTVDRIKKELDEDGLSWNGETALIMHILAIGCALGGDDSLEYNSAAKRRMGFAVEKVTVMAIQAHYLQGYLPSERSLI